LGVVKSYLKRGRQKMRIKVCIAVILAVFLSSSLALYATSFVSADGAVHSVWTTVSGITYLKIERPDGSKVNADCMNSDQVTFTCQSCNIGDPASGFARCDGGVCTWLDLSIQTGG
jgi:hypothetical protein